MCRLFGMVGAGRVHATFWLLEAPDSLAVQSRREPDGAGIGAFREDGTAVVDKTPLAAYADRDFAREARELESRTFVAHVRFASTGAVELRNTHPFEQRGRLFAHNGVIGDLPGLERRLGERRALVHGDTDSERFFALITDEIEAAGGDVAQGIARAASWVAATLPVFALNCVLTTPDELFALRYPETHELFVLERPAGGPSGDRHLEHASRAGGIRAHSADLATRAAAVFATEPMDDDARWRLLDPGELLRVGPDLEVRSSVAIDSPPAHPLALADLDPRAAASQAASAHA